jgi:hypothetical protein
MSEKKKHNPNRRKHYHDRHTPRPKEVPDFSVGKLKAPATTLFILSWLMASCKGKNDIEIRLTNDYITGPENIVVSGIPQGATNGLSPECTVITITGGADLLEAVPVISDDFASVDVTPKAGVEGPVTGSAEFGKTGTFGCKTEHVFPFVLNIDTDPTTCDELSQGGGNITLMCDGEGQILDKNTGQVLATIASPATVPVDQNARTRSVIVQDPAGNQKEMTVSLATNCQQVAGVVQFNSETDKVQIQLTCDGPGVVSIGNEKTKVNTGANWANLPQGGGATGNVNFNEHNTAFSILLTPQNGPTINVQNLRNEGGELVADANCITAMGDNCIISFDGESNTIPGRQQPGKISTDADIGPAHNITVQACDTVGNCSTGTTTAPDYNPFGNIQTRVITDPKNKKAQVIIQHPDEADNIEEVHVSVNQHDPKENRGFNRVLNNKKPIVVQADCNVNAGSNGNVTIFDCNLPFDSGRLEVRYNAVEAGGGESGAISVPSTMPELGLIRTIGVEASPYATGLMVAALVGVGISRMRHQYKDILADRGRQEFLQFMNEYTFPQDTKERQEYVNYFRKELVLFGNKRNAYEKLFNLKLKLKEVMDLTIPVNTDYNPESLFLFFKSYLNDQAAESLMRTTLKDFDREREGVKQTLLTNLDQYIQSAIAITDQTVEVRRKALINDKFIDLLKMVLRSPDNGWFWEEAKRTIPVPNVRTIQTEKHKKYPHISKASVRYLLLAYLKDTKSMDKHWDEYYELFRTAGITIKGVEAKALQKKMIVM